MYMCLCLPLNLLMGCSCPQSTSTYGCAFSCPEVRSMIVADMLSQVAWCRRRQVRLPAGVLYHSHLSGACHACMCSGAKLGIFVQRYVPAQAKAFPVPALSQPADQHHLAIMDTARRRAEAPVSLDAELQPAQVRAAGLTDACRRALDSLLPACWGDSRTNQRTKHSLFQMQLGVHCCQSACRWPTYVTSDALSLSVLQNACYHGIAFRPSKCRLAL
jgi:hypothetical protein